MNLSTKRSYSKFKTLQTYTENLREVLSGADIQLVEAKFKVSGKTVILKKENKK